MAMVMTMMVTTIVRCVLMTMVLTRCASINLTSRPHSAQMKHANHMEKERQALQAAKEAQVLPASPRPTASRGGRRYALVA